MFQRYVHGIGDFAAVLPQINAAYHVGRVGDLQAHHFVPEGKLVAQVFVNVAAGIIPEEAPVDVAVGVERPLRRLAQVLVESFSTIVFAILVIAARIAMYHSTWPSRSYMLVVAAKLALAWLMIRLVTSVIRNAFLVKLISVSAWVIAC